MRSSFIIDFITHKLLIIIVGNEIETSIKETAEKLENPDLTSFVDVNLRVKFNDNSRLKDDKQPQASKIQVTEILSTKENSLSNLAATTTAHRHPTTLSNNLCTNEEISHGILPPSSTNTADIVHRKLHNDETTISDKYTRDRIRSNDNNQRTPSLLAAEDVEGFFNNLNPSRVTCVPEQHEQHPLWQQQQLTQLTNVMPPSTVSSQEDSYVYTSPTNITNGFVLYSSSPQLLNDHNRSLSTVSRPYDAQYAGWEATYSPHTALKSMTDRYGNAPAPYSHEAVAYSMMPLNATEASKVSTSLGLHHGSMTCEWNIGSIGSLLQNSSLDKNDYYQLGTRYAHIHLVAMYLIINT